jgi:hypothetical protein
LLAGLGLLALAWPGWLAKDAGSAQQERRVAWSLAPDESSVLAAKQLAQWYDAGKLRAGEARGFHLPFQFGYYCAWYCPAEKILFDFRMTDPSLAQTYVDTRKAFLALRDRPDPAPAPPDPRTGPTHVVLAPPIASILSRGIFYRSDCFPLWAIAGQSFITGWCGPGVTEPYPALRLDPVALAATQAKTPAPTGFPDPPPISAWDRFRTAPRPVAAESQEAALWLVAREAATARASPALALAQIAGSIGRAAPVTPNDFAFRLSDPLIGTLSAQPMTEAWQRGPDGRMSRVAPLLAIRAARRGIIANPDDYEVYLRLLAAYDLFDSDQPLIAWGQPSLNQLQQVTAARQALVRLPYAASFGQNTIGDEHALQSILLRNYERMPVLEGISAQPLDLILEAFSRVVDLEAAIFARRQESIPASQAAEIEKAFDNDRKQKTERLAKLQQDIRGRSDAYENRAAKLAPGLRAELAVRFGLPREALRVLQSADPKDLDLRQVLLMLHLLVLAGEAADAHTVLQGPSFNPITVLPTELQPAFRILVVNTAAALGDTAVAIDNLDKIIANQPSSFAPPLIGTLQWLVFPDLGTSPLTRGIMTPLWFGLFPNNAQASPGQLVQMQDAVQQYCNNIVRQGLLALEYSNLPLAKLRFQRANNVAGPFPYVLRGRASAWLDLFKNE